ncbi:CaiB/BaiF CoA transferase family protein [Sphingobacterium paludis]|jgi:CoA:oxalate CoA-transferase|uniref:Crotonobetainyl-CoA:carnitine CoA-transferase CaiB-like acyl-CoA transferase n=1 Tax=Sphingobacterium paludis TaxID=1476465 RepID=A0A4R7CVK5_9SPHI|nr:CoA transferase [Sphingobacterium paludis]TDS10277.1 crotonobetainyl-CoA:carnitine CoA-transferase CaiB-like acyl-CoA transferase [Sphingobacterium paludis]
MLPLADFIIVDFSQFLSGPLASLRLADLGARVIKVEKPITGDICRQMYTSDTILNGTSTVFHAINRNKESVALDIKDDADRAIIRDLIAKADVVMHNFRPGVMERLGFDYSQVREINPNVVYAEISGYGKRGPWAKKPGQDLLLQSLTGMTWLSGDAPHGPVPMGLSIVDMFAGMNLASAILACLYRRAVQDIGAHVQVSMLDSAVDIQFEAVTTYFRDGKQLPQRTEVSNAHAYLAAPYGIYKTADGFLALAMGSIPFLSKLLDCPALAGFADGEQAFQERTAIKEVLANHLATQATAFWLSLLEAADIWCADVLNWDQLTAHDGFKVLEMLQRVSMGDGFSYDTTRCPIRIDGERLTATKGSPALGEHTEKIKQELYG